MIPYSHTKVNQLKIRNQMLCSHSKRGIQCMFSPIGLPLSPNRLSTRLTQDQKGLSKDCNGDEGHLSKSIRLTRQILGLFMQVSKQANHTRHRHFSQTRLHIFASVQQSLEENQFDKWLITMRCKEFTYCLCNFIWPRRSRTFMFVQLRALFKPS
ncbi:hypothetical protein H5410_061141, partial [Solanum commersonii]